MDTELRELEQKRRELGAGGGADKIAKQHQQGKLTAWERIQRLTDEVLSRVKVDKKRIGANLRFVAIREVGLCEPVEIAVTDLSRILRPVPGA